MWPGDAPARDQPLDDFLGDTADDPLVARVERHPRADHRRGGRPAQEPVALDQQRRRAGARRRDGRRAAALPPPTTSTSCSARRVTGALFAARRAGITAQTPGLSAEEMERYFTIPIEVGLEATPGVENIRSTSFYGLSFVRVSFAYGVDYYFALTQAEISLQQNVSLPNNVMPKILGSSLVGEIYRYQLVGPPHFGLNNLRTIQDWILQRRLLSIPGVVQVNTWGGTTKEYEVEVDLQKLEAYSITLPQIVAAIGNANTNVGGRTLELGEQSVNIRGVGLIDSGGTSDLTQGYRVDDIESIVLAQQNGVPVTVKEVAHVYVGNAPRLGKAGRDHDDDVVAAIVVMNRTQHTNDVAPRIRAEVEKINSDGTLPPGVKVVPFYDRTSLIAVTTATVTRNLVLGFILIVIVQWLFLGDLRGGLIIAINIPFALFFTFMILVLRNEDANLLSFGAVDLGVIVDAAVILVESIYRNFQAKPGEKQQVLHSLAEGRWGDRPDALDGGTASASMDGPHAPDLDQRTADRKDRIVLHRHHRGGVYSALHHAGRRRSDFRPDGEDLRVCADRSADCDFHGDTLSGLPAAAPAYRGG